MTFNNWHLPYEVMFWHHLERSLSLRWDKLQILGGVGVFAGDGNGDEIESLWDFPAQELDEAFLGMPYSEDLLAVLLSPDEQERYVLITGRLEVDHEHSRCWLLWPITTGEKYQKLLAQLDEISGRAEKNQWALAFDCREIIKPDRLELTRKIKNASNEVFNARLAATIGHFLVAAYVTAHNRELAETYVDCLLALAERPKPNDLNNIGYVALSRSDYELAAEFLRRSLQSNEEHDTKLTCYNLGICLALDGKLSEALEYLRRADAEPGDDGAGCIITIAEASGGLSASEVFEVDSIGPHVKEAIEACTRAQQG